MIREKELLQYQKEQEEEEEEKKPAGGGGDEEEEEAEDRREQQPHSPIEEEDGEEEEEEEAWTGPPLRESDELNSVRLPYYAKQDLGWPVPRLDDELGRNLRYVIYSFDFPAIQSLMRTTALIPPCRAQPCDVVLRLSFANTDAVLKQKQQQLKELISAPIVYRFVKKPPYVIVQKNKKDVNDGYILQTTRRVAANVILFEWTGRILSIEYKDQDDRVELDLSNDEIGNEAAFLITSSNPATVNVQWSVRSDGRYLARSTRLINTGETLSSSPFL
jgi:hypothetical protein